MTNPPVYGLATGAGKDATHALHRARAGGLDVRYALVLYEARTARIAVHGTRRSLVAAQARALGLEPILVAVGPGGFEPAFRTELDRLLRLGVCGLVMGNIHLADVRAWYEERTKAAGLEHVEPLWEERPGELVREFIALGYRATVVSVDLAQGDPAWLGRELDLDLLDAIENFGADSCGERGEYHTFVWDGPGFREPVEFRTGDVRTKNGHRLLDLIAT